MNRIDYLPAFEKYYKKLKNKQLIAAINNALLLIRENPAIGEAKSADLAGIHCYDVKHKNINYEIAYRVIQQEAGLLIIVIMAGTRENFYQVLKRYMK